MMEHAFVLGVDHHHSSVDVRELLARVEKADLLRHLQSNGVREAMCLSTCNRFELYGVADCPGMVPWRVAQVLGADADTFYAHAYHKTGTAMVRHGFAVASSLESMVVGEPQILGQMKDAWQQGRDAGTVHTYLDKFCTTAFHVGKRVRTETEIAKLPVSVASAAVRLAADIHGDLRDTRVLLVGAGDMCLNAARHLKTAGAGHMMVTNRSPQRAIELAAEVGGNVLPFEDMAANLARADVVITSTASPTYVITEPMVREALRLRRQKPIFIVDIAVPRDVDPLVGNLPDAFVYDIDQLGKMVEKAIAARSEHMQQAHRIVDDEVDRFSKWSESSRRVDVVRLLRDHFEEMRAEVLTRARTPEEATRLLMNKILHNPTVFLRQHTREEDVTRLMDAFGVTEKDAR
ncbi:MAG: glutamyl-tRNA reductase [Proteobacteria bacterium]|nr:glutamyl-tRNA reductase [Pseudomonadota bacterium]